MQYSEVSLSPGNVLSDEPGYYEDGKFGIRIENIIMAGEKETAHRFGDKPYLGFDTYVNTSLDLGPLFWLCLELAVRLADFLCRVTMVPMCRKLIDVKLLTDKERNWVNEYHKIVKEKIEWQVSRDQRTMKWLERETEPL